MLTEHGGGRGHAAADAARVGQHRNGVERARVAHRLLMQMLNTAARRYDAGRIRHATCIVVVVI